MQSDKSRCLVKRIRQLHKDERGMSLVEVIIAMTILGIVAVPVLHSLTTSMVYNAKARTRQELTLTAESIMESFKGYDLETLTGRFSPTGDANGKKGIEGISLAVSGVDPEYDSDPDNGTGFHYQYDASALPNPTAVGGVYTFSINEMKADNGQIYDVTITATPNSIEKVMEPMNMETTRDAIYIGDRAFDTGALAKAKDDFKNNHQSDLRTYFATSYSDAVIKRGTDLITIKDEEGIAKVFEEAYAADYVGNYLHLHEKRMEFVISNNGSDEYVVTPKMYYSYHMEEYPYYKPVEPGSLPDDEYGGTDPDTSEPNAVVQDGTIRYPATGELEFEIDLDSDSRIIDGTADNGVTEGYIYKNPVTAGLDRLFVYYYPQYNIDQGCDKIVIKNDAGITNFECYILKQRTADINDNQMKIKENGYKGVVDIQNSAAGFKVFHNFDDNIADGSSTTAPSITGTFEKAVSYTNKPDGMTTELTTAFSEEEVLSYKLKLDVTQNGRTITTLESSMNEKIR